MFLSAGGSVTFAQGGVAYVAVQSDNLQLKSTTAIKWSSGAIDASSDLILARETANQLSQRNAGNAQIFNIYNTHTDGSNYERLQFGWGPVSANVFTIRTQAAGTGTARTLQINYGGSPSVAVQISTSVSGGVSIDPSGGTSARTLGALRVGNAAYTVLSGTNNMILHDGNHSDGGTNSSTVVNGYNWSPTINFTGATRSGRVSGAYFNPTNTSLPTGLNASIIHSLSSSTLGGELFFNTGDETTNAEFVRLQWSSNVFNILSNLIGAGTARGVRIGTGVNAPLYFQANGTDRWNINGSGHFLAVADNSYDIGATGATRPRHVYVATTLFAGTEEATITANCQVVASRAGTANIVVRDTTNNVEALMQGGATGAAFGSASNHDMLLAVNNATRWIIDASPLGRLAAQANYGFSHGTSALATTDTEGFFHMNSCAGAPTGVPASIPTGQIPFVFDTTNDRLYFYYDDGGGAGWHYIARTA